MKIQRRALIGFSLYFSVTLSKRFWLPSMEGAYFWFADVSCFVFLPMALIVFLRLPLVPKYDTETGNSRRLGGSELIFVSALCAIGLWLIYILAGVFGHKMELLLPNLIPKTIDYISHIPTRGLLAAAVVVYFALTAGLVEEYVFRGLARSIVSSYLHKGVFAYVLFSATTFALIHWGSGLKSVVSAFFAGILLAVVFARTRDIRVTMIGHTLFWLRWLF